MEKFAISWAGKELDREMRNWAEEKKRRSWAIIWAEEKKSKKGKNWIGLKERSGTDSLRLWPRWRRAQKRGGTLPLLINPDMWPLCYFLSTLGSQDLCIGWLCGSHKPSPTIYRGLSSSSKSCKLPNPRNTQKKLEKALLEPLAQMKSVNTKSSTIILLLRFW